MCCTETKSVSIELANISTGENRTLTMADYDIDMKNLCRDINATGFNAWSDPTNNYYSITGTPPGTLTFTILKGGTGFIKSQPISWTSSIGSVELYINDVTYIYISVSGNTALLNKTNIIGTNDQYQYIFLYRVLYDGSITNVMRCQQSYVFPSAVAIYFQNNVGPIIRNGGGNLTICTGTGNPNNICSIGDDIYDNHSITYTIPGGNLSTAQQFEFWYKDLTTGFWKQHSTSTLFTNMYYDTNTNTVVTSYTGTRRVVFRIAIWGSSTTTSLTPIKFICLLSSYDSTGTIGFKNATDAVTAISDGDISIATPSNEIAKIDPAQLGYAIVFADSPGVVQTVEQVVIVKQTMSQKYVGGSTFAPASHMALSDISGGIYGDGGHTQLVQLHTSTVDPTINDDISNYKLGTVWVNTTKSVMYTCMDNSEGSAVWRSNGNVYTVNGTQMTTTGTNRITHVTIPLADNQSCAYVLNAVAITYSGGTPGSGTPSNVDPFITTRVLLKSGSNPITETELITESISSAWDVLIDSSGFHVRLLDESAGYYRAYYIRLNLYPINSSYIFPVLL